jgi:hypothetical protein
MCWLMAASGHQDQGGRAAAAAGQRGDADMLAVHQATSFLTADNL